MAKCQTTAVKSAAKPAPERSRSRKALDALAIQASYEVEALAKLLTETGLDQRAGDTFVYLARGIGRRIDTLNGIMMYAVHENEVNEGVIKGFERDLYGACNC